ncbi:MAG: hypothetical protein WA063_02745 [Minisyncoccia bacterium]
MNQNISKDEIQRRAGRVEDIYQEYFSKLNELKKKQNEIIDQFIEEMEQKKIEEVRKTLIQ